MDLINVISVVVLSPLLGVGAYYFVSKKSEKLSKSKIVPESIKESSGESDIKASDAKISQHNLVSEARSKAKEIIVEAKSEALKIKESAESKERDITIKEAELKIKEKDLVSRQEEIKHAKKRIDEKEENLSKLLREEKDKLEKIASLTKEEARKELLKAFDHELLEEKAKRIRAVEEEIKKNKDKLAQEILIDAMRHGATDYVVAHTTSKVKLPDEDIKGRIIGKEGRNIKAFEEVTGVDLDLDSSPGEVIVSSFDAVRREIAKVSLEKLITDGRFQPAKIEEIVAQTKKDIDRLMRKEGENLCHRVGAYNIPDELIKMLGKFKYRYSYGQNMIEHTLEETRIGMAIARELNADIEIVKLGCLFHDIGKVVSDEEGTHVDLGVELLKKHKVDVNVINTVAEHHEDRPFSSIESAIVALADHISGARPGARSEDYEAYLERMKALEDAATSFDGIAKAYAISAGREVRVYVLPEQVDDASAVLLAREIAKKIELEQSYPGVVKVTVIRETRVTEIAK